MSKLARTAPNERKKNPNTGAEASAEDQPLLIASEVVNSRPRLCAPDRSRMSTDENGGGPGVHLKRSSERLEKLLFARRTRSSQRIGRHRHASDERRSAVASGQVLSHGDLRVGVFIVGAGAGTAYRAAVAAVGAPITLDRRPDDLQLTGGTRDGMTRWHA